MEGIAVRVGPPHREHGRNVGTVPVSVRNSHWSSESGNRSRYRLSILLPRHTRWRFPSNRPLERRESLRLRSNPALTRGVGVLPTMAEDEWIGGTRLLVRRFNVVVVDRDGRPALLVGSGDILHWSRQIPRYVLSPPTALAYTEVRYQPGSLNGETPVYGHRHQSRSPMPQLFARGAHPSGHARTRPRTRLRPPDGIREHLLAGAALGVLGGDPPRWDPAAVRT